MEMSQDDSSFDITFKKFGQGTTTFLKLPTSYLTKY